MVKQIVAVERVDVLPRTLRHHSHGYSGPLQAALGEDVASAVRYDAERSLNDYIDSVARILPRENTVLVAESFSGAIALSLLARYPARIRCAVLCATFSVSPFDC